MNIAVKDRAMLGVALSAGLLAFSNANAGATFKIDDTKWLSVGAGLRTSFAAQDSGAGATSNKWSTDFHIDNIRLYVNGQVHKYLKIEFNTDCGDCTNGGDLIVLDAIGKVEINDYFNLWAGRQLVPSDRAELDGPFYQNTYEFNKTPFYPSDQGSFDAGKFGRDDGVNIWGALTPDKKLTYVAGVFNGRKHNASTSNVDGNLLYAGRVSYNFLNVEKNPGYYTSSTYYGTGGNILTVAVATQYQEDGAGSVVNPADFWGSSADVLGEFILPNAAVGTFEAEYKHFELNGVTPSDPGNFGLFEGDAYTGTALYLIPQQIGIGKFQPYVRYTYNDPQDSTNRKEYEAGINYVIASHNARVSLMYQYGDIATKGRDYSQLVTGNEVSAIKLGLQLQI
ncbi:MAG: hypothetical protein PHY16_14335 [Methylobacter sp.]|nr:hypothetical protein [Methylobacter sp.]